MKMKKPKKTTLAKKWPKHQDSKLLQMACLALHLFDRDSTRFWKANLQGLNIFLWYHLMLLGGNCNRCKSFFLHICGWLLCVVDVLLSLSSYYNYCMNFVNEENISLGIDIISSINAVSQQRTTLLANSKLVMEPVMSPLCVSAAALCFCVTRFCLSWKDCCSLFLSFFLQRIFWAKKSHKTFHLDPQLSLFWEMSSVLKPNSRIFT